MKRLTLVAVPLVCATLFTARAQQQPDLPSGSASSAATTAPSQISLKTAEARAQILMAQKSYAAALDAYKQILLQDPRNAEVLNQAGIAYQGLGELDRAEHFYKLAARADKTYASPVNNLGTVEFERKNYGKATHYYEKAILIGTGTPTLELNLGVLYLNLGYAYFAREQYPLALDSFAKALTFDPDVFGAGGQGSSILEERSARDPGLLFFLVARVYAKNGDAERTAHYLKIARDDGYAKIRSVLTDPDFAAVINDPRVQDVLAHPPAYAPEAKKPSSL